MGLTMFYDLLDYLHDTIPIDVVDLHSKILNLLESIPYIDHETSLADMLMTADNYPTVETLNSLNAILEEAMRTVIYRYGFIIDPSESILLIELYELLFAIHTIYTANDLDISSLLSDNYNNEYDTVIDTIVYLVDIEEIRLHNIILTILPQSSAHLTTIADYFSDNSDGEYTDDPKQVQLLKKYPYLDDAIVAKTHLNSVNTLGYDFITTIDNLAEKLLSLPEKIVAINIAAIYYGSSLKEDLYIASYKATERLYDDLTIQARVTHYIQQCATGTLYGD